MCVSSLRRGHANLLCIVPILADDLFRGSNCPSLFSIYTASFESAKMLCRFYFKKIKKTKLKRGRAGIEPATSPTRRENHTSRPTALGLASNEDRTRDLVLTRHMLCQLSYRGVVPAPKLDVVRKKNCLREKIKKAYSTGFEPATLRFEV